MKKVLRILSIVLGAILLVLIAVPILFKSKIEEAVKSKVNQEVQASVDWSRFTLTFFRGFPDLSVNLHQVSVVGQESFQGDTLAGIKRFEFRMNPFSIFNEELEVKSIFLDHPLMNGIVMADGKVNWDIASAATGEGSMEEPGLEAGDGSASSFNLLLQRFAIKGGRIYYKDRMEGTEASLEGLDLELSGDFSMELTEMALRGDVESVNFRQDGISYLKGASLGLDLLAEANLSEERYTLKKNEIRINGLVLGAEGVVSLLEEGAMELDLSFYSRETSFKSLLSLIPAIYLVDYEDIETGGMLKLEGRIQGLMKDTILPDATLVLEVRDGYLAYPGLPENVKDIQIKLAVDYSGTNMDLTTVDLEKFHFRIADNPFKASLRADHPVSDMHVAGEALGLIDFASLQKAIPLDGINLDGRLEADLRWDTKMSFIEQEKYELVDLDGTFLIENMNIDSKLLPVPVALSKMEMHFTPRFVDLVSLDLMLGSSDFHMNGKLANFIPYLFNNETISGSLNVSSSRLNYNEMMASSDAETESGTEAGVNELSQTDTLEQTEPIKIPENINFEMNLQVDKLIDEELEIENLRGRLNIKEGVAYLEQLTFKVIDGEVKASGQVDTRGDLTEVNVSIAAKGIDIPAAYTNFVSVERLAPMAKYCKGTANLDMQYHSFMDASYTPLYESIDAHGNVYTKGLQIYDLNTFVKLSELLKNKKFQEMAPDEIQLRFTILDGRVMIAPFDMNFESSTIKVSGSHGIDMTLDYLLDMNIAKSDLGEGASSLMSGMSMLAMGAGIKLPQSESIKVKAKITGTFDKPKISTDLSDNLKTTGETLSKAVEERVKEEVKKVEEDVREEAGKQAEEMIAKAEAEAVRLMEEARKAGEALVKEADLQGENLIKEAGNNALKQFAAKKAADELKRQATKQSENLLREAQEQGDVLIEKARLEAAKI